MDDQAKRVEKAMKPVTTQELEDLGAKLVGKVWEFPDGSRGKLHKNPIAIYDNSDEKHEPCGFIYFEKIESVH